MAFEIKQSSNSQLRSYSVSQANTTSKTPILMTHCLWGVNITRHSYCTVNLYYGFVYMWDASNWIIGWDTQGFTTNELWEFYEIATSWPSAEKERFVGDVPQRLARVTPRVWLFPGDLLCWLIWLCFAQNSWTNCCDVIARWCSCAGWVALFILHHSPPEYRVMDWTDGENFQ